MNQKIAVKFLKHQLDHAGHYGPHPRRPAPRLMRHLDDLPTDDRARRWRHTQPPEGAAALKRLLS